MSFWSCSSSRMLLEPHTPLKTRNNDCMLLPKLKAPRPLLEDLAWCPLLPMHNDAFPAPPSPINTALSSCNRGGFLLEGRPRVQFFLNEKERTTKTSPPLPFPSLGHFLQKKTQKDQPARPRHRLCLSFLSPVVFFSSSGATKQQPTWKQRRSKKNTKGRTSIPQHHRQLIISFVPAAHTRRRVAAATPGVAPALPTTSSSPPSQQQQQHQEKSSNSNTRRRAAAATSGAAPALPTTSSSPPSQQQQQHQEKRSSNNTRRKIPAAMPRTAERGIQERRT